LAKVHFLAGKNLPVSSKGFMCTAGAIEMFVGLGILSRSQRVSSYAASLWLLAIAANLFMNDDYDVAVRDVNMAVAAFALAQLSSAREQRIESRDLSYDRQAA
jgi:hypothetical protein